MPKFQGFRLPQENWFRLPNEWTDITAGISSLAELKVIEYVLRHTWGFGDQQKHITLDEFQFGRKRVDGERMDSGIGVSQPHIINGIRRAVEDGFLEVFTIGTDRARVKKIYRLRMIGGGENESKNSLPSEYEKETSDLTKGCDRSNERLEPNLLSSNKRLDRSEKDTSPLRKKLKKEWAKQVRPPTRSNGFLSEPFDMEAAERLKSSLKGTELGDRVRIDTLAKRFVRLRTERHVSKERIKRVVRFMQNHGREKYTPKLYKADDIINKFTRIEDAIGRTDGSSSDDSSARMKLIARLQNRMEDLGTFDVTRRVTQKDVDFVLKEFGMKPGEVKSVEV